MEKEKREKALAKAIADGVNVMVFDHEAFCEQMSREHRTLQQSFTRLCIEWIRHCVQFTEAQYDGRNEASVMACRKMAKALDDAGSLPMV